MKETSNPAVRHHADRMALSLKISQMRPAISVRMPLMNTKTGPKVLLPLPHSIRMARMKRIPAVISSSMHNVSEMRGTQS